MGLLELVSHKRKETNKMQQEEQQGKDVFEYSIFGGDSQTKIGDFS
jgi:hypothetical protein